MVVRTERCNMDGLRREALGSGFRVTLASTDPLLGRVPRCFQSV